MAGKIFINYRRDDSIGMAGRLHDRLAQDFGHDNIFMDVDNIPVGEDFVAHLNSQVAACDIVLAVIGKTWLKAKDKRGQLRLNKSDDWVAIELAAALTRNIRVIPILVDGARMPTESELPESLRPLARRQAAEVRHAHFGKDAEVLVERMREVIARQKEEQKQAEARTRQQAEEEARRLEAKRRDEEEARQLLAEAKRGAEEEARRSEVVAKQKAEEEQRRKEAEAQARQRAEEERAEVERQAERERKRADSQAQLEAEARRKATEEAEARRKAEKKEEEEKRPPSAQPSPQVQGPRSATPEQREEEPRRWSRRTILIVGGVAVVILLAVATVPFIMRESPSVFNDKTNSQNVAAIPQLRWRLASSFPRSIPNAADIFIRRAAELSGGRIGIELFDPGVIINGLQVADGVSNHAVDVGYTMGQYFVAKDPTFVFLSGIPFGLEPRAHLAWRQRSDVTAMFNRVLAEYSIVAIPCGAFGRPEDFLSRKPIRSVADLNGLKMQVGGWTAKIYSALNVVPQQLAAGDIYPALEKGTIDAVQWLSPRSTLMLGFNKVTRYSYYPGVVMPAEIVDLFINKSVWDSLPAAARLVLEKACADAANDMIAEYETADRAALAAIRASGNEIAPLPVSVQKRLHDAYRKILSETASQNASVRSLMQMIDEMAKDTLAGKIR